MRRLSFSSTLAVATYLLGASPALATWNNTEWGMTVEEVLAAVGESGRQVRDDRDKRILDARRLVTAEDTQTEVHYTVDYLFEGRQERLTKVNLVPETNECADAHDAFAANLGERQTEEKRMEIMPGRQVILESKQVWQDPAGQGTVSYMSISFETELQYCQILFEE